MTARFSSRSLDIPGVRKKRVRLISQHASGVRKCPHSSGRRQRPVQCSPFGLHIFVGNAEEFVSAFGWVHSDGITHPAVDGKG
jgi:hypothetical protein